MVGGICIYIKLRIIIYLCMSPLLFLMGQIPPDTISDDLLI